MDRFPGDTEERQPWETGEEPAWLGDRDAWRGELHFPGEELDRPWLDELDVEAWPEDLAGPEYWLFKDDLGDG